MVLSWHRPPHSQILVTIQVTFTCITNVHALVSEKDAQTLTTGKRSAVRSTLRPVQRIYTRSNFCKLKVGAGANRSAIQPSARMAARVPLQGMPPEGCLQLRMAVNGTTCRLHVYSAGGSSFPSVTLRFPQLALAHLSIQSRALTVPAKQQPDPTLHAQQQSTPCTWLVDRSIFCHAMLFSMPIPCIHAADRQAGMHMHNAVCQAATYEQDRRNSLHPSIRSPLAPSPACSPPCVASHLQLT